MTEGIIDITPRLPERPLSDKRYNEITEEILNSNETN
jgi:hypothetical protein